MNTIPPQGIGAVSLISEERLQFPTRLVWGIVLMMNTRPDEIGTLLPNNQRQHRTLHIQKDVLPYAL